MLIPSKMIGLVVLGVACEVVDSDPAAVVAVPVAPVVLLVALVVEAVAEAPAPVDVVALVLLPWASRSVPTDALGVCALVLVPSPKKRLVAWLLLLGEVILGDNRACTRDCPRRYWLLVLVAVDMDPRLCRGLIDVDE